MASDGDPDRNRRIVIADYDPAWPATFEALATQLKAALGDAAMAIQHFGSTSVPGLAAKPVIDIHLTVADSADEGRYRPRLEACGYEFRHRDPDWFEHRLFKHRTPEANLHVFTHGCPEVDRCRLFRDWLRESAADRDLYAAVKRDLARRDWSHVQAYAEAKHDVVSDIMRRAEAWDAGGRSHPPA